MTRAREPEVIEALNHTSQGRDVLVQGGAGSGKTHSMLDFLKETYRENPTSRIACVTFTNVAVNEIRSRFPTVNLEVSTIHDFLWSLIQQYQKNLGQALSALINAGAIKSVLETPVMPDFWHNGIKYKEWMSLEDGEISHDQVLAVARQLFVDHPTLKRILADRFDYLVIDEYQDTPVEVLRILLEELGPPSTRDLRLCFFGDGEQAIHEGDKGKALVDQAIAEGRLHSVTKISNRRNPAAVIRVINELRRDGLVQEQARDAGAPNVGKEGTARFVYTVNTELDTGRLTDLDVCADWDFSSQKTKLLYLGKSMIAREGRFPQLMAIYNKDRVVEYAKKVKAALHDKPDAITEHLTLGEVIQLHGADVPPTPALQAAFDADPSLLRLAAGFAFEDVVSTSSSSDRLLGTKKVSDLDDRNRGEKRDAVINHLVAIEEIRWLYQLGKFNAVLRAIDRKIESIADREHVTRVLEELCTMDNSSIGDVVTFVEDQGLLRRRDEVLRFQERHPYRYSRVTAVPFAEIANLYAYVENHSPYSTQHGVKGSEWDNVFVSLDNGGWNHYNFERLFADPQGAGSVVSRSRMMLYVTCSRAKENLVVYIHQPTEQTLDQARNWFEEENVVALE